MPLMPYIISGHIYKLVPGTGTSLYENAKICAYNVTKGGYISTTSNDLGELQIDLSDTSVATNADGYENGDVIQLYSIDTTGLMSMCYRHTIAAGDAGVWSQDVYLHATKNITFRMGGSDGTTPIFIDSCLINKVTVSNITATPRTVWLFDRTNDILRRPIECPANNSVTANLVGMKFDGGVCVEYEVATNDSSGHNDLECSIGYSNRDF